MCGDRLSGPYGTGFLRRVVANGEDEIHLLRPGYREFVPTLAAKSVDWDVRDFQLTQRFGTNRTCRVAACAVGVEGLPPLEVQDRLRHDRVGGVAGAQEQNVVVRHRV